MSLSRKRTDQASPTPFVIRDSGTTIKQDGKHLNRDPLWRPEALSRVGINTALAWVVVGALGAVEGIYGRTQYMGDWISYLNVSRAVTAHDWKGIFDPMWSPGYPILVAMTRAIFPHTPEGEWHAISLLNWSILLMAYGSWRYLIREAFTFGEPTFSVLGDRPIFLWISSCAFLSSALCLNKVSSVCPDLLVTTLFILAVAQTLSLVNGRGALRAIGLGIVLGVGCWVKGAFLSFSVVFVLVLLLLCRSKKISLRSVGLSSFVLLVIFAPFVAGISKSYGQFTVGDSGVLNYAFHVNHLPHWTNWQGGPSVFGTPLNPTRQLIKDLPIFEFGSPFRTTYPPYNNMSYWYRGARKFFSLKLQFIATGRAFYFLASIVKWNPFLCGLTLALFTITLKSEWRAAFRARARAFWPLFLPAILGLAVYLAVHVEDRYIGAFCLIFSLLPLLPLLDTELRFDRFLVASLLVIYTVGAAAELAVSCGSTFRAAIRQEDFHSDPQWKVGAALPLFGLQSGDAIALIAEGPTYRCHWAYISGLRIVAEFGSLPWTIEPWDRTRFDHILAQPADEDYALLFWKGLTPGRRAQAIDAFRLTEARAILSLSRPDAAPEPGWQEIAGTNAWIYLFQSNTAAALRRR